MSASLARAADEAAGSAKRMAYSSELFEEHGHQYVSFLIGDSRFAIDINSVREIRAWTGTTRLPDTPEHIRGVINLRGEIVPVMDVRSRFGQGLTDPSPHHVIIVVSMNDKLHGLLVDTVSDLLSLSHDSILPIPLIENCEKQKMLGGIATLEQEMIAIVDLNELVAMV